MPQPLGSSSTYARAIGRKAHFRAGVGARPALVEMVKTRFCWYGKGLLWFEQGRADSTEEIKLGGLALTQWVKNWHLPGVNKASYILN